MALSDPWAFPDPNTDLPDESERAVVVLAGGCFWCTEAVYAQLAGVLALRPGYAGDDVAVANYRAVCSGRTNHAEVIEITYDPTRLSYGKILKLFFSIAHDPTQKDRQGADVGRQYRSAIFYQTDAQRAVAAAYIAQIEATGLFPSAIMTQLEKLEAFYPAEPEHHDYARRNPGNPYIRGVSLPKVKKMRDTHPELLKQYLA
jgi:peptide-methionine (S)-S-oxide reductase